ncbi:uncharacterized protein [Littorina saxatilis]|uniref:uncharacterized protein n=1 Tax=Littorina saxatilis TaxID=31220 RepID=UPI0038B55D56
MAVVRFLYLLLVINTVIAAPSLNNCGGSSDDRFAEVIRGSTNNTFTCSLGPQDTGQLEWRVQWFPTAGGQQREDGAGQCPSPSSNTDTCTSKSLQPAFIPSRTSASHSVMTVNPTELFNKRVVSSGSLVCKVNSMEDRCTMDYITPASGTCSTQVVTSSSPWKPSISCTITQGNSSRGRYQCQGSYRKQGTSQDSWTSTWVGMSANSLPHGQASCSPPSPSLPPDDGRYSFRVRLRPGRQFVDAGTVELRESGKLSSVLVYLKLLEVKSGNYAHCLQSVDTVASQLGSHTDMIIAVLSSGAVPK